jgi:uncharacterized repeat protein (TIGR01451 family)
MALAFAVGMMTFIAQGVEGPPAIAVEPAGHSVVTGDMVTFAVEAIGAAPLRYQWRQNGTNLPGSTNASLIISNAQPRHWGNYTVVITNAFGAVTSSVATLLVDADLVFRILALQTNSAVAVEHNRITGDDRGGIAVSADNVFVTGDGPEAAVVTGRFPLDNLGAGAALGQGFDALTSNLRTETVYSLGNGANPIQYAGSLSASSVNSLLEIDGVTGQLTGRRINLSTNIPISTSSGVFAGYDRVVIYSSASARVFDIRLPSGAVTDLGSPGSISRQSSESWAFWGVAEYFAGSIHLLYAQNVFVDGVSGTAIGRTRVADRTTTQLLGPIPFPGLSDMASFTFSISRSRWFFHHEGTSIFRSTGGPDETVGSAKASFTTEAGYPALVVEPVNQVSYPSSNVTFRVVASGEEPFTYQWFFNGSPLPDANGSTLVLPEIETNAMGFYSVEVSNPVGTVLSRRALLTIYSVPQVVSQPRSVSAFPGTNVFFFISLNAAPPIRYQWFFNGVPVVGATNSFLQFTNVQPILNGFYSVVASNRFGSLVSSNAQLNVVVPVDDGSVFQITSLTTNGLRSLNVYETPLEFDLAYGPLAVSSSQVFYSDNFITARSSAADLSGGVELTRLYAALASNLRTETVYALGDVNGPFNYGGGTATRLWEINGANGALSGARVNLSSPIVVPPLNSEVGFFSGYDRIVILAGQRAYNIDLPSGSVTDLGPMLAPSHAFSQSGSFWGVAEHAGGIVYLVYARSDNRNIARTRVPDGVTTNFVTFPSISFYMASITASVSRGRWYYHYIFGNPIFGNGTVVIGYASATFTNNAGFKADRFEWDPIGPLQSVDVPFPVTLTARTAANSVATNYDGEVTLAGLNLPGGSVVPITPTNISGFVNGVWTGQIAVAQGSTGMVLRAFDAAGVAGTSSVFNVSPPNDLVVTVTDHPDPVLIGTALTYTLFVTNTGPSEATSVTLTNLLPANFALVSVNTPIGACAVAGRVVSCDLGTVGPGTVVNVTIVGIAEAAGTLTNQTAVARGETDSVPANNAVVTRTTVVLPSLVIDDTSTLEGDSGTNQVQFTVRLLAPSTNNVSVNYQTLNSSATGTGGLADFVPASGTLVFPPGTTNQIIAVGIRGDPYYEPNEVFLVSLSNPTNASVADNQGSCTIQNDDPIPTVSVADITVTEGNAGTTNAIFQVRLSAAPALPVFVTYSTAGGTAQAGTDFIATNGFVTFPPGNPQLTRNIIVPVRGDTNLEPSESFRILINPTNAVAVNTQAVCTILTDDGQGMLHHFAWSPVASPQRVNVPFNVTLVAQDTFNRTVTNFTGSVAMSGGTGVAPTNIFGGADFTNSFDGDYTLGFSFVPKVDITVTHFRHYTGTKVSLWTDAGAVLASRTVTSSPGTWLETPLDSPVRLTAGATYVVAYYTGAGPYYFRAESETDFADLTLLSGRYQLGDQFPDLDPQTFGWAVDIRYTVGEVSTPVGISPTNTSGFVNGEWSGPITILSAGTNVILRAVDSGGRSGLSAPFDVLDVDESDVWVEFTDFPTAILEGDTQLYAVLVHNRGQGTATDVTFTNLVPDSFLILSALASQGTVATNAPRVTANLGTLAGGASATISIAVRPQATGVYTNRASAASASFDPAPGNNHVFAPFVVYDDTDGDGMWDSWETQYNLNPGDASDAGQDADGDGHSNYEEFLAGTHPNDPQSITRIVRIDVGAGGVRITVQGARGRTYLLERQDPTTEAWSAVLLFRIGASLLAPDTVEVQDPSPASGSTHLYRILVVPR